MTQRRRRNRIDPGGRDPVLREGHASASHRGIANWTEGREIATADGS
jgi:hypothetical protein